MDDPIIEFINMSEKNLNANIRKHKPFPDSNVMTLQGSEAEALTATVACIQLQASMLILAELHNIRKILEDK